MPYRYLDDIATADVAFYAWGRTVEEMFAAAAEATVNVMVEDPEEVEPLLEKTIAVSSDSVEMLLFEFLQEIIFLKDAERLLLRVGAIDIVCRDGACSLEAVARGEEIDAEKHRLGVDVKAVTLHRYRVEPFSGGWEAEVILDI